MASGVGRSALDFPRLWDEATPYERFASDVAELRGLWHGVYRTARVPEWALERARVTGRRELLCIVEDWCWDAANTVPLVARLCDAVADLELRVIGRDAHPEVMDRYLTGGSRSIPIIVVFDQTFNELGHWGPRPRELQAWAARNRGEMEKSEFYAAIRRWYVMDRGESTLTEVLEIVEAGADVGRARL